MLSRRSASPKLASAVASAAHETHGVAAVVGRAASIVVTDADFSDFADYAD